MAQKIFRYSLIAILIIIIFITYRYYTKKDFIQIEKNYVDAAKFIYESGVLTTENAEKIVLTRDEINILLDDLPLSRGCNGYVIITINKKVKYKSYISCVNDYKTPKYNKEYVQ